MADSGTITRLLMEWKQGDQEALHKLTPLVYNELRRLANIKLKNERPNVILQPTVLVHEAYLRLIDCDKIDWKNRAHFFGVAAQLMRNILVDNARNQAAAKRGASPYMISLADIPDLINEQELDLLALDEALTSLAAIDKQQAEIVELRYFGGLTIEETAEMLGIATATVSREWKLARVWLRHEIHK